MNIIQYPTLRRQSRLLFCFVDLQVEYVSQGRAMALAETEPWSGNVRRLLELARGGGVAAAHFRQLRRGAYFNAATVFAEWIDAFRPRPSEMVFERPLPSCYSAPGFVDVTEHFDKPILILSGLTSTGACLATAIDAYHRGHECLFVADASWTAALGRRPAAEAHQAATDIISQYVDVCSTDDIIERTGAFGLSLTG